MREFDIRTEGCHAAVSGVQMAAVDRATIEAGTPGIVLMERAGEAVERVVFREVLGGRKDGAVAVVCGKGNNGGDGFVVARLLITDGVIVSVFLVGRREDVRGDAAEHLHSLLTEGAADRPAGRLSFTEITGEAQTETISADLRAADCIVDAILGTGLRGGATGLQATVIDLINEARCRSGKPVVSIDIPSGVDASSGKADGSAVIADITVTFGLTKVGHWFHPGRAARGDLRIADIGIPGDVLKRNPPPVHVPGPGAVKVWLPVRSPDAHKGTCGRVVVVAGSVGLTGAATLTSMSAARIGAGLVTLGVPESLNDILEVKLTEVMTRPLPEVRKRRCLSLRAEGEIEELLEKADCLAIGPGLGVYRETREVVRRVLQRVQVPVVVDADALNALAGDAGLLRHIHGTAVLTPHVGEFARLTGRKVDSVLSDPIGLARSFAAEYGVIVVLKGAPTIVAEPSGKSSVNPTGNPGMASGGVGDVLTGVIAGLIAQGMAPLEAAVGGVFIHGLAGDLAWSRTGGLGLLAGELLSELPRAIAEVLGGAGRQAVGRFQGWRGNAS